MKSHSVVKAPDSRRVRLNIKLEFCLYPQHKRDLPLFTASMCGCIHPYASTNCADSRFIQNIKVINERLKSRKVFLFYKVNQIGCVLIIVHSFKSYLQGPAYGQGQNSLGIVCSLTWIKYLFHFEEGHFNIAPAGSCARAITSFTIETYNSSVPAPEAQKRTLLLPGFQHESLISFLKTDWPLCPAPR